MSKIRIDFTKEQKLEIVKLSLDKVESIKSLAVRFDVSESTILHKLFDVSLKRKFELVS